MKKYIGLIAVLFVVIGIVYATSSTRITNFPNGLVIGTEAEETAADVTPGDGDLYIVGTLEVDGAVTFDGTTTQDGIYIKEPYSATAVILDSGTALSGTTSDSFVLIVGSFAASAMISSATPFISTTTATAGQMITIMGTDATATVQLSDNGTVSGSQLELDGNTIVLGEDSSITLIYYDEKWIQCGGINTID